MYCIYAYVLSLHMFILHIFCVYVCICIYIYLLDFKYCVCHFPNPFRVLCSFGSMLLEYGFSFFSWLS